MTSEIAASSVAPKDLPTGDINDFERLVATGRSIKEGLIDPNREWYRSHQLWPFIMFRSTGIITIILSVALPAVASINEASLDYKSLILSVMSVTIAALTGLSSFFRWERSWRGRNNSKFAIDTLVAKWELEIENARSVVDPSKRTQHVYLATNDLLTNFRSIGSEENEQFFSGMQFPQSGNSKKDA